MSFRTIRTVLALAIATLVGAASRPAEAAAATKFDCTVTAVAFDQHIFATCAGDGNNYLGYTTAELAACAPQTNVTIETLKIWESMLVSALLSGRKVDIYYNTPTAACNARGIFNLLIK